MKTLRTIHELSQLPKSERRVFVPTMGALHAGHGELIRVARTTAGESGIVIVSVFVNPLQFGPSEDFNKYPRTEVADVELALRYGADYIWFPEATELLAIDLVQLSSPEFGLTLEGAHRPGHFDGVLTIVNRLFDLVKPTHAIFGVKDLQQLILIRQMAKERHNEIEIVPVETVRSESGLALSSRNKYLTESELKLASQINKALNVAALHSDPIARFTENLALAGIPATNIDYVEVIEMPPFCQDLGERRLVVAVRIGSTRLLDNIALS